MDVHWHATADGEAISADGEAGGGATVGFGSWEDGRECLLFAVVDRLVALATCGASDARRQALLRVAEGLEAARRGWRWSGDGGEGAWSLLVCTDDACACEVLPGPAHGGSHAATAG